jgi:hypothetical protein
MSPIRRWAASVSVDLIGALTTFRIASFKRLVSTFRQPNASAKRRSMAWR